VRANDEYLLLTCLGRLILARTHVHGYGTEARSRRCESALTFRAFNRLPEKVSMATVFGPRLRACLPTRPP